MLRLHAAAHRAPHEVGQAVYEPGNFLKLPTARYTGRNVTQAGEVLERYHGPNDAVVTLGGLQAQLVLDHPARACHRLRKAQHHL